MRSGVKRAITEPDALVAEALRAVGEPRAERVAGDGAEHGTEVTVEGVDEAHVAEIAGLVARDLDA